MDKKKEIAKRLLLLGFVPSHRGYRMLITSIMLTLEDIDLLDSVTYILYPEVAKRYNTTTDAVERNIRFAIKQAWANGSKENWAKEFGQYPSKAPSNAYFISMMVEMLSLGLAIAISI